MLPELSYGTTHDGGPRGTGTVFKLARDRGDPGWTETVLYTFKGTAFGGGRDGANPYGGLVFDAAGNLHRHHRVGWADRDGDGL